MATAVVPGLALALPHVCWLQQAKMSAADGAAADYFGRVVALSGQTAVAGAYLDDNSNGTDAGSAYINTAVNITSLSPGGPNNQ